MSSHGLAQAIGIDDCPEHASVLPRAADEPVALQDGQMLRDVGPADLQQLGELAGRRGESQRWCISSCRVGLESAANTAAWMA